MNIEMRCKIAACQLLVKLPLRKHSMDLVHEPSLRNALYGFLSGEWIFYDFPSKMKINDFCEQRIHTQGGLPSL